MATVSFPNGHFHHCSVEGPTYEEACSRLDSLFAEDHKLLVIRADN